MVVSSGLPITLVSRPFPCSRFCSSGIPWGCMKIRTPSSSALAQNGSNLGDGQLLAVDVSTDSGAAQPQLLDAFFQLLGREVGMLQRHRCEGHKPLRMGGAQLRQFLVLDLDQLARHVSLQARTSRD